MIRPSVALFVESAARSPFAEHVAEPAWIWTQNAEDWIAVAVGQSGDDYAIDRVRDIAIHRSATIEGGAVIKGPALIGPRCFVAATAYLRGGVFLDEGCIVGPAAELKTSFMFAGSKLAHLNFVGDSVLGAGVNIEAGAMIANYRNERADKHIRILREGAVIETGVEKFGALVGDGSRLGANAVIAPGAILDRGTIIPRLALIDQAG